jgi:ribosomal protein S6--L-glutamate ligase
VAVSIGPAAIPKEVSKKFELFLTKSGFKMPKEVIALERRLKNCKNVITLGVRTNFSDYSPSEAELIRQAEKIYYPTAFYADLFDAMGKTTFPSYHTYKCVQDKIKQTALFEMLDLPHPRTRVFYGDRQKQLILNYFKFPFIGKIPRGSAMGRGVYLIHNEKELRNYLDEASPAYIQEYLRIDRDMRVVVIGNRIIHAYWRIVPENEYRSNVALGGEICLASVPEKARKLALKVAQACCWDDVGIDICEHNGQLYILEANMKYGREGFRQAGLDYAKLMESMIENEEI